MNTKISFRKLALTSLATLALSPALHADVTFVGDSVVAEGGVALGSSANYDFFGPGEPVNLTDFSLTSASLFMYNGGTQLPVGPYSTLQVPGGGAVFTTGCAYSPPPITQVNLATFTVNSGEAADNSFSVYIHFGNTDMVHVSDASIGLSIDGAAPIVEAVTDTAAINQFLQFDLTGIAPGDTLTISATSNALDVQGLPAYNGAYVGGVTFGDVTGSALGTVPEPSTWAMMLGSMTLLGVVRRLRRARRV